MKLCGMCGNEIDREYSQCPHCGGGLGRAGPRKAALFRVVNIHDDRPTIPEGLVRLRLSVENARSEGVRILKIIHGYGASGQGGDLRIYLRRECDRLIDDGSLRRMALGEDTREVRALLAEHGRKPPLKNDPDLSRPNKGVTWLRVGI